MRGRYELGQGHLKEGGCVRGARGGCERGKRGRDSTWEGCVRGVC